MNIIYLIFGIMIIVFTTGLFYDKLKNPIQKQKYSDVNPISRLILLIVLGIIFITGAFYYNP